MLAEAILGFLTGLALGFPPMLALTRYAAKLCPLPLLERSGPSLRAVPGEPGYPETEENLTC